MKQGLAAILLCALLAGLPSGCARAPETAYKSQFLTLGTLVDVSLWGVDDARAAEAVRAVEQALDEVHHLWHAWEPGELTRINTALAAGEAVSVDADVVAVLRQAARLARASDHLFNPAIGRLVALWGFHGDAAPSGPPPPEAEIERLVAAAPTMDALEFDDMQISSANPAVQIDLGAFAKGLGIDRAIEALRALGIDHAIVNAGGDLRAIGSHGDRPWRIGIRHPVERGVFASLETRGDESVFTSGNYERYFDHEGKRYHHVIDPRSGRPAQDTLSVTVIHDNAAEADAAATALFVAGPAAWRDAARRLGITQVMLIDADMNVHLTPAMAERIRFEVDPLPAVFIGGDG
jgi:FAD:protein FMN transferase